MVAPAVAKAGQRMTFGTPPSQPLIERLGNKNFASLVSADSSAQFHTAELLEDGHRRLVNALMPRSSRLNGISKSNFKMESRQILPRSISRDSADVSESSEDNPRVTERTVKVTYVSNRAVDMLRTVPASHRRTPSSGDSGVVFAMDSFDAPKTSVNVMNLSPRGVLMQ